jgi:hypothetical protein
VNTPLYPERLLLADQSSQAPLALSTMGVQRYVWESRFGAMLIEVIDGQSFVNGALVELPDFEAGATSQPPPLG